MELKTWILKNIDTYGPIIVRYEDWSHWDIINNEADYDRVVLKHGEEVVMTCYTDNYSTGNRLYIFWHENTGYLFTSIRTKSTRTELTYFNRLLYKPNWYNILTENGKFNPFENCGKCKCYNDKLITGWCNENLLYTKIFQET